MYKIHGEVVQNLTHCLQYWKQLRGTNYKREKPRQPDFPYYSAECIFSDSLNYGILQDSYRILDPLLFLSMLINLSDWKSTKQI